MSAQVQKIEICHANQADFSEIWKFFEPILRAGETYPYDPELSFEEARATWFAPEKAVYIAKLDGSVCGTYYMRPNQEKLGAHVANCGYMVDPLMQGKGIGMAMGLDSLERAKNAAYSAMQFNLVVSTNIASIKLWQKLGFKIVGTIPNSFNHKKLGLVDSHIMYKIL